MRKFKDCESGNFGMLAGLLLPVLLASAGLAVDYSRMTHARNELQNALDSGVLAASRSLNADGDRKTEFKQTLAAQLQANGNLDLAASDVVFSKGLNYIEAVATATVNVPLLFMDRFTGGQVSATASTFLSTKDIEVAIVLDNTGSMGSGGISALKNASHALVDALSTIGSGQQGLKVALVPFVTSVNIKGEGFDEDWIDTEGEALYNGWAFLTDGQRRERARSDRRRGDRNHPHHMNLYEWSGTNWKGCVEARPAPYNTSTTPPSGDRPDTLFVPYFAPDEPGGPMSRGGNDGRSYNNSWLDDHVGGPDETRQRSVVKYKRQQADPDDFKDATGPLTLGPNRACPTPIVPLTPALSKIRDGINAMQYWNGSGTNIAEGLAWGWRVLSPQAPYTQAKPYDPQSVSKILVVMTDGTNVSFGSSSTMNKSDYGSYGFLSEGRIDGATTQSSAEARLNTWTAEMCQAMKAQNIELYTVIYKTTARSVTDMFRNCASKPENFFMAKNTTALQAAFSAIGRSVAGVRLTN